MQRCVCVCVCLCCCVFLCAGRDGHAHAAVEWPGAASDCPPPLLPPCCCQRLCPKVFDEKTPLDDDAKPSEFMGKGLQDKLNWMKVRACAEPDMVGAG